MLLYARALLPALYVLGAQLLSSDCFAPDLIDCPATRLWEDPLKEEMACISVFLPEKSVDTALYITMSFNPNHFCGVGITVCFTFCDKSQIQKAQIRFQSTSNGTEI